MTAFGKLRKQSTWLFMAAFFALGTNAVLAAGPKGDNLVDVAVAVNSEGPYAGAFDTLIAAVLAADPAVVQTLTGNGQHTVFAPTAIAGKYRRQRMTSARASSPVTHLECPDAAANFPSSVSAILAASSGELWVIQ